MLEFVILFGIVVAVVVWNGYRRARDIHLLTTHGLPVTGSITAKKKRAGQGTRSRHIEYTWTVSGQTCKGRSFLNFEQYDKVNEGDPIALVYLAGNPKVAAPDFVVETSRKAAAEIAARQRNKT